MRLASEKEIQTTSRYAQKFNFESQELSHRSVAGEIIQPSPSIQRRLHEFCVDLPTFAFIGRRDTDEEVRERFDVPWKENVGGPAPSPLSH